jgi:hypothetical protein
LHNTSGPAIVYPDGWEIYAIGGVRVDEQVVVRPETQTMDQIRKERNAEVKRIRIERYGWSRYLDEINAVVLDQRLNDIEVTREVLMRSPEGETVLVCACPSTGKLFSLEVPPTISTCEEAQNFLSGGLSTRIVNAA